MNLEPRTTDRIATGYYSAGEDAWRAHEAIENAITHLCQGPCRTSLIQQFDHVLRQIRAIATTAEEAGDAEMEGK